MINHSAVSLVYIAVFRLYTFLLVHWMLEWKDGEYESLDSCWTLLTLLMDPKLDCQKLRHCLGVSFFCWQLIVHQKYVPKSPQNTAILGIKITVFTCLLSSDGRDSFSKHQGWHWYLTKQMKGLIKKQWNARYHDKSRRIITCLFSSIHTIHIFIGALDAGGGKRVNVRFLTVAEPS